MNNKKLIPIIIGIIIILIGFFIVLALINYNENEINKDDKIYTKGKFIKIDTNNRDTITDDINTVITSKDELLELFPEFDKNLYFTDHNYVLFEVSINSCGEENVQPTGYNLDKNRINIKIEYTASCGVCAPEYEYYLLEIPKTVTQREINLVNKARNNPKCDPTVAYKPMIYLYPKQQTEVTIKLGHPEYLTTTYPKYNDGWTVLVKEDGTIETNNREYYGLFWEGNNHQTNIEEDGFIVEGKNTEKFLEEKLNILGLTNKEANEFIIYWLPKLENNKYNYIRFETLDEINNYMPLNITPEPNTIIRILMDYKPLNNKINIKEQELIKVERTGFTVVEWGGSLIK